MQDSTFSPPCLDESGLCQHVSFRPLVSMPSPEKAKKEEKRVKFPNGLVGGGRAEEIDWSHTAEQIFLHFRLMGVVMLEQKK